MPHTLSHGRMTYSNITVNSRVTSVTLAMRWLQEIQQELVSQMASGQELIQYVPVSQLIHIRTSNAQYLVWHIYVTYILQTIK